LERTIAKAGHDFGQHPFREELEVGRLPKKMGVVRGDQVDEPAHLLLARGRREQPAVGVEAVELQRLQALGEPAGDERLSIRPQLNPAPFVDQIGQVGVGIGRESWFQRQHHVDPSPPCPGLSTT
jgi:hypothetical protein